ncbi:MAG: DUF899 family protein [Chloroflexota bacterium]|nr:DUF899 family protein [Chloroflexota bacterium]
MTVTFPNESPEYRAARNDLLEQEIALRRETAAVADQRSKLPVGGVLPQDYVFEGTDPAGLPARIAMSDLFESGKDTLLVYSFMFTPDMANPCPGCTGLMDTTGRTVEYIRDRINMVIVADAPLARLLAIRDKRGWFGLPMLSTAGNSYSRDYFGLHPDGYPLPMVNVFRKIDGTIHHFWGAEMLYAPTDPGQDSRSNDSWDPVWNLLDLTPEGRGTDWDAPIDFESTYPPAFATAE